MILYDEVFGFSVKNYGIKFPNKVLIYNWQPMKVDSRTIVFSYLKFLLFNQKALYVFLLKFSNCRVLSFDLHMKLNCISNKENF